MNEQVRKILKMIESLDWDSMYEFSKENEILPEKYSARCHYEWTGEFESDARRTYPARQKMLKNLAEFALEKSAEDEPETDFFFQGSGIKEVEEEPE